MKQVKEITTKIETGTFNKTELFSLAVQCAYNSQSNKKKDEETIEEKITNTYKVILKTAKDNKLI